MNDMKSRAQMKALEMLEHLSDEALLQSLAGEEPMMLAKRPGDHSGDVPDEKPLPKLPPPPKKPMK